MRSRWRGRPRRTVVLGTEMAAARAAEARHNAVPRGTSPLADVRYELGSGELDLFRFVASPADDAIERVIHGATVLHGAELERFRDSLTQDDLYTMLTFARRAAIAGLRGGADQVRLGLIAVGLIDVERIDWRDAAVAAGLLGYAVARTQAPTDVLDAAVVVAEPATATLLRQYATAGESGLSVGGYREVQTPTGPALVQDYGEPYRPSFDLLAIANRVVTLVEADRYQVTAVTTGTDIAAVWLPSADAHQVAEARRRVSGCVSISAAPRSEALTTFPEQMLLVYVAECASADDAELLVRAAVRPAASDISATALRHGQLFVELIARSTVKGVAPIETVATIERFRPPIAHVLAGTAA